MNILVEQSVISMEVVTSNSAGSLDKILIFDLQGTRGEQAYIKLTTMIRSAKRESQLLFRMNNLLLINFCKFWSSYFFQWHMFSSRLEVFQPINKFLLDMCVVNRFHM